MPVPRTTWAFGTPQQHMDERNYRDRQTGQVVRTVVVPELTCPLLCNGQKVGYINVHMHAAKAPDAIEDASFGFTGRVNSAELQAALNPPTEETA